MHSGAYSRDFAAFIMVQHKLTKKKNKKKNKKKTNKQTKKKSKNLILVFKY